MLKTLAPLAVMAAFATSACTTPASVDNAGLSDWEVVFTDDGRPKTIRIRDGKEKADVSFKVDLQNGKAEYSATDVKAFDAIMFAADLAKVQANEQGQTIRDIAPEAIPAIVDLARTFAGR